MTWGTYNMKEKIKEIFGVGEGRAARQFTFKPPTWWGDFSIMAERPVPHQLPHHQQQFGFHPRTYSKCYEEKKPAHQEYSIQKNYVSEMKEK